MSNSCSSSPVRTDSWNSFLGGPRLVFLSTSAIAVTIGAALVTKALLPTRTPNDAPVTAETVRELDAAPLLIVTHRGGAHDDVRLNAADIVPKLFPSKDRITVAHCLHLLNAFGTDFAFEDLEFSSSSSLLEVFTDEHKAMAQFGVSVFVRTRHGIRQRIRPDVTRSNDTSESHCDQFLASMAQLGLPLTTPVAVGAESLSLRELLSESLSSFDIKQREIDWTAISYALYLPPRRAWENRFKESFTFDDLAVELLNRKLSEASCCGVHLAEAMTILLRVDSDVTTILSPIVRARLSERLVELTAAAISNQHHDGSWRNNWHQPSDTATDGTSITSLLSTTSKQRQLPTSHLPHWLRLLPLDFQVPPESVDRACRWCYQQITSLSKDELVSNFCPSCHMASLLICHPSNALARRPQNDLLD